MKCTLCPPRLRLLWLGQHELTVFQSGKQGLTKSSQPNTSGWSRRSWFICGEPWFSVKALAKPDSSGNIRKCLLFNVGWWVWCPWPPAENDRKCWTNYEIHDQRYQIANKPGRNVRPRWRRKPRTEVSPAFRATFPKGPPLAAKYWDAEQPSSWCPCPPCTGTTVGQLELMVLQQRWSLETPIPRNAHRP